MGIIMRLAGTTAAILATLTALSSTAFAAPLSIGPRNTPSSPDGRSQVYNDAWVAEAPALAGATLQLSVAAPGMAGTAMASASTDLLWWEPTATLFWSVNGPGLVKLFMTSGQCTEWAETKRPDVLYRSVLASINYDLAHHLNESIGADWSAKLWAGYARAAGIPVGHAPRKGALIVFQPGVLGAGSPSGHIAYVERVNANGSFLISQMHAPTLGKVSFETLTAANGRLRGVTFIYS